MGGWVDPCLLMKTWRSISKRKRNETKKITKQKLCWFSCLAERFRCGAILLSLRPALHCICLVVLVSYVVLIFVCCSKPDMLFKTTTTEGRFCRAFFGGVSVMSRMHLFVYSLLIYLFVKSFHHSLSAALSTVLIVQHWFIVRLVDCWLLELFVNLLIDCYLFWWISCEHVCWSFLLMLIYLFFSLHNLAYFVTNL